MHSLVINTGPIIALVAATETIEWLPTLYNRIFIPYEVFQEIEAGGPGNPEILALSSIKNLVLIGNEKADLPHALLRELDTGEASVIHSAILNQIDTVAIDEKAVRRLARINGLKVTGSLGILLKAKRHGLIPSLGDSITRMRNHGIWIASDLITASLRQANED